MNNQYPAGTFSYLPYNGSSIPIVQTQMQVDLVYAQHYVTPQDSFLLPKPRVSDDFNRIANEYNHLQFMNQHDQLQQKEAKFQNIAIIKPSAKDQEEEKQPANLKPSSSDRAKDVQQAGLDFNFGENLMKSKSPNKFAIIEESDESQ